MFTSLASVPLESFIAVHVIQLHGYIIVELDNIPIYRYIAILTITT